MDEKTRANALEKAADMTSHIAYPDELLDDRKLDEFYEGLELNSTDYLGSILNLTIFGTNFSFGRLRKPVNKTEWITHGRPAVVNAFYSSIENSIRKYLNISNFTRKFISINKYKMCVCLFNNNVYKFRKHFYNENKKKFNLNNN